MLNARREQYSSNIPASSLHSSHFLYCLGEMTDLTETVGEKHYPIYHINQTSVGKFCWVIWSLTPLSFFVLFIKHNGSGTSLCGWKTQHAGSVVLRTTICLDRLASGGKRICSSRVQFIQ